jgi:SAM-dependent methyltransferase
MNELMETNVKHFTGRYDALDRWLSYWYQSELVRRTEAQEVIEIGCGNKTVSNLLKRNGIKVLTVDNDPSLGPDQIGDVLTLPLPNEAARTILCAEVLEHLPFEDFPRALAELRRVAKEFVVLSLPHWGISFRLSFKLPLIRPIDLFLKIPWPRRHVWNGEHYWEIGKTGFPVRRIRKEITKAGFRIEFEKIYPDNPAHHYFLLKKI